MTSSAPNRIAVSVSQVRQSFADVVGPDDAGYDAARAVFYRGYNGRPAVIIRPRDASEVARVIGMARDSGLPLAVRSGGHSLAGHSVGDDGIVLDLSNLRGLDVDVSGRTAWAQSGMTAGEYTTRVGAHGLATGFGDTGSVGIGGLTVGGGIGFLVRKYGLTIDNLLAAEVVTADGQVRHVDHENDPDLFWAIRGGGGNFGVVTRFQFRLHEVATVTGGLLMLPATPEVIASFVAESEAAPEELSAIANVMVAPPMPFIPAEYHGQVVVMAMLCHTGSVDDGERAVAPFRALTTPIADMIRPMPYPEIYQLFGEEDEPGPQEEVSRSMFVETVNREAGETVVENLLASTAPLAVAQFRVLGGAMARVPAEASAFAHRDRRVMVAIGAVYEDAEETPVHDAWVSGFAAALNQGDPAVYVNFLNNEDAAKVRDAYPETTWDRLVAIKRQYDPANLFRLNHNVPPAVGD